MDTENPDGVSSVVTLSAPRISVISLKSEAYVFVWSFSGLLNWGGLDDLEELE